MSRFNRFISYIRHDLNEHYSGVWGFVSIVTTVSSSLVVLHSVKEIMKK